MQPRFDVYVDRAKEWRWTFYAANGLKVADSAEGYTTKQACLHGLGIVKGYAANAKVNIIEPARARNTILGGGGGLFGLR